MSKKKINMMRINRWLNQARWAPSIGNSQPWVVRGRDNGHVVMLEISVDPNYVKGPALLDQYGAATAMSLGALAFNLELCARTEGLQQINLDHSQSRSYFSNRVTLVFQEQLQRIPSDMTSFFKNRYTDRSVYLAEDIDPNVLQVGRQILSRYSNRKSETSVKYIEWGDGRETLIENLLPMESIRWTNTTLRGQVFEEINLVSPKDEIGVPPEAMGARASLQWGLLLAKSFGGTKLLNPLWSALIGPGNLEKCLHGCNRIFYMGVNRDSFEAWFRLGMALQDVWLHYNQNKICFQPLSLNLIAYNHLRNRKKSILSSAEAQVVEKIHKDSEQNMGLRFDCPMIGFRVGNPITDITHAQVPRKQLLASPMF